MINERIIIVRKTKANTIKHLGIIATILTTGLATVACSNHDETLATYNGGKITTSDYLKEVKQTQAGKIAMQNMIIRQVLEKQYGDKITTKQVNQEYQAYEKQYGQQFPAMLEQQGLNKQSFKNNIKSTLLAQAALKDQQKPTKKQEQTEWQKYQPAVTVQHILVTKKSTAAKIIKQLNNGANFNKLVKKYSLDTASVKDNGKLPAFDSLNNNLDPNFKAKALDLKPDHITASPVKSASGYHVIKCLKKNTKGSFKDHQKAIDKEIYAEMAQDQTTMHNVISKALKKAGVKISDKDLNGVLDGYLK